MRNANDYENYTLASVAVSPCKSCPKAAACAEERSHCQEDDFKECSMLKAWGTMMHKSFPSSWNTASESASHQVAALGSL